MNIPRWRSNVPWPDRRSDVFNHLIGIVTPITHFWLF